ncbi:MAG: VCBS repeat-containing protein [Cyanobacteria bacterium P01_F01_bin.143]
MARFSFNLANIDGNNGFFIDGIRIDEAFLDAPQGPLSSLNLSFFSSQGDFNGDRIDDLPIQSANFIGDTGVEQESFVIFGSGSFPRNFNLGDINGNNGVAINNTITGFNSFSDVNGDNIDDLLLTSFELTTNSLINFVILGDSNLSSTIDPTTLNGSNGFNIIDDNGSLTPFTFKGDINGDTLEDLIFLSSSTTDDVTNTVNKIVFGQPSFASEIDISTLDGNNGFIVGGWIIFNDGGIDVNGDTIDDLIFIDNDLPQNYVLFGSGSFADNVDVTTVNESNGFVITDSNSDVNSRLAGVTIPDLNGDGIGELAIQQNVPIANNPIQLRANRLDIIFGGNNPSNVDLASLNGSNGFTIPFPVEVTTSADLNGDGIQDLIVLDTAGIYCIVFGSNQGFSSSLDLASLNGTNGFAIANNDITITDVGDVNGDNIDDLIIDKQDNTSYVLFGSQEAFTASIDLTDDNSNALLISGFQANNGVANVSDLNNDGFDDIVFNPVVDDNATTPNASSAVLFGDDFTVEPPEETIDLFRFRNTTFNTGTYIFVGEAERDAILSNPDFNQTFELEGDGNPAFRASTEPGEGLLPFFRLQSLAIPGTFLFVSTEEYNAIFAENSDQRNNFQPEGFDESGNDIPEFYLFGAGANQGIEFNRFQNNSNNTFLFAGPGETTAILADPNLSGAFTNQGVAFEALNF